MSIFSLNDPNQGLIGAITNPIQWISNIFTNLFNLMDTIIKGLNEFKNGITELISLLQRVIDGIKVGNIDGLPVLEAIGTYRYLVGDIVFHFTYFMVLMGIGFTLFKLLLMFYKILQSAFNLSGTGLLNGLASKIGISKLFG